MKTTYKIFGVLLFVNIFSSVETLAWGEIGHRIVGDIAQTRLNRKARRQIKEIMGNESLARASTWADEIKSEPQNWKHASPWHYTQMPPGTDFHDLTPPKEGDVYTALLAMEKVLKNPAAKGEEKRQALRFIVHFIGDLHQPLHVGNGADQGGNWCQVLWFNNPSNLHAVWDTDMIDQLKLSFTEYSRFLNDALDEKLEKNWMAGHYDEWIIESGSLRDSIYPKVKVNGQDLIGAPYCRDPKLGPVDATLIPKLSYNYGYEHRKLLDQRLTQGGLRLAYALNQIFDGKSLASTKVSAP